MWRENTVKPKRLFCGILQNFIKITGKMYLDIALNIQIILRIQEQNRLEIRPDVGGISVAMN